ncbi:uncharacterized protein [Littorina saxatilis]|uniref:uncharacterized protein n=1 Tax=Littorina saxatilis TaxID=31220 RepID=UPI0038B54969
MASPVKRNPQDPLFASFTSEDNEKCHSSATSNNEMFISSSAANQGNLPNKDLHRKDTIRGGYNRHSDENACTGSVGPHRKDIDKYHKSGIHFRHELQVKDKDSSIYFNLSNCSKESSFFSGVLSDEFDHKNMTCLLFSLETLVFQSKRTAKFSSLESNVQSIKRPRKNSRKSDGSRVFQLDDQLESSNNDLPERKSPSEDNTRAKPTADGSGNGTTLKDTHRSTESSKKIEQTLSSKTDDASDGGHSSHTQLQPPVQSKPQSESLPGKQLDFDKEEGAKPAEASGGQVSHQEQTKAEPKTHENFPQLKVLAALTWERASSGTESSDSSDSSDPYEGMYSGCSSCSNRDDSAVSSTATGNSKPPDVKDSTSSRSSDTLQDLSSRGRHLVLPASVQGTTREHDPEMLDYSEETTGLSQNENIMLISVLMVENPSLIMSVCTSSEDDETVHTVFHFSTPVTVSSFDSQEQHQSYHEYIPIVSPIHTDMPKFIQDFASQRKKMPQDGETSTLSLTSNPRSGPILAHPEDETGPFVIEEQWVVIRERQGATGYTARPQHTGSCHCSEGTPMQTSILHHVQWEECSLTASGHTSPSFSEHLENADGQIYENITSFAIFQQEYEHSSQLGACAARTPIVPQEEGHHFHYGTHPVDDRGPYIAEEAHFSFIRQENDQPRLPAQYLPHLVHHSARPQPQETSPAQPIAQPESCCQQSHALSTQPSVQSESFFPGSHAPVRLPPMTVHAAGSLPPWATMTARIDLSQAAARDYAQLRSRRATYEDDWPTHHSGIDPTSMALAGFFRHGRGRRVRCFYCGLELDPSAHHNIWDEHVRYRPTCAYLRAVMGSDFVLQTQMRLGRQP